MPKIMSFRRNRCYNSYRNSDNSDDNDDNEYFDKKTEGIKKHISELNNDSNNKSIERKT